MTQKEEKMSNVKRRLLSYRLEYLLWTCLCIFSYYLINECRIHKLIKNMTLKFQWWGYFLIAISFFIVCALLNFLVKKINEAKLEVRLNSLQQKISTDHSTQAQESSTMEPLPSGPLPSGADQLSFKGISFVYNKDDNLTAKGKDNSNVSSAESTKENSLKFLGKIYDDIKPSKDFDKNNLLDSLNSYKNDIKINGLHLKDLSRYKKNAVNDELEIWISKLLMNYVLDNWRRF